MPLIPVEFFVINNNDHNQNELVNISSTAKKCHKQQWQHENEEDEQQHGDDDDDDDNVKLDDTMTTSSKSSSSPSLKSSSSFIILKRAITTSIQNTTIIEKWLGKDKNNKPYFENDHSHGDGTNDNNGVEIAILAENTVQPPPTPQEQQVFHDDDDDDVLGDDILCDLDNEEEDDLDDEDEDGNGRGRRRGVAIYVENDNEFIARHVDSEDIEGELSSDSLMMFVSNESQAVYVDNSNNSSNSNSGHSRKSDERREQGDQSFDSGDYNSNRRGGDAEDEETRQANSPISLFRQQDSNEYDDGEQQRLVQGQGPFMAKVEDDGPEFEKQQQQEEETQKDEIAHTQDSKKKNNKNPPPTPETMRITRDISKESRRLNKATELLSNGMEHWCCNEFELALKEFRRALILRENLLGCYNAQTLQVYFWIALCYDSLELYDEALVIFRRTLRIQIVLHGDLNHESCDIMKEWINKILTTCKKTNTIYCTMYNKALLSSIQHQINGVKHLANGDGSDATREFLSSLALERSCKVSASSRLDDNKCSCDDTDEADLLALIGDSYMIQKKYTQAYEQYSTALFIYQDKLESTHYSTLRTYHKLIRASTKMSVV